MREPDFVDECYADKDLSLLKKLTLVIPTYNRNYYLSRCLWYHAHFPFGEIIVADSSPEEKKVVNRETVAKVREMFGANIRYLEYEPETDKYGGDIYRKWGDAVQHVETAYTQICTDKEFLIPNSLEKCIQFLELHDDYISSGGREYQLHSKKNIKERAVYYLIPGDSTRISEINENALKRLSHAFVDVAPMHNSLLLQTMKTEVHKDSYQKITEYQINDIRFGEIILGYIPYLSGKYHFLENDIFVIRDNRGIQQDKSNNFRMKSSESSASRYKEAYANFDEASPFYTKFKFCLLEQLISNVNMERNNAEFFIDTTIKKRVIACTDFPTICLKIKAKLPMILIIWYCLPKKIQNSLNKFTNKIFRFTIPTGIVKNIDRKHIDVKIITKIVAETTHLQSQDKPVSIS